MRRSPISMQNSVVHFTTMVYGGEDVISLPACRFCQGCYYRYQLGNSFDAQVACHMTNGPGDLPDLEGTSKFRRAGHHVDSGAVTYSLLKAGANTSCTSTVYRICLIIASTVCTVSRTLMGFLLPFVVMKRESRLNLSRKLKPTFDADRALLNDERVPSALLFKQ
ncbi:hypothetical protein F5887DRAFT_50989 [Amanita rubescens]|nr:hypothetical protein F5887DRAFT_50989 [Amanita rubescens]